jgi:hypothetical protein
MTLEQHRAHLFNLLSPPTTWHWWPHVEHRAYELAADAPEFAGLPEMVKTEFERVRQSAKQKQSGLA